MIADVRSTGQDIRRTPRQISDADNAYFQVAVVADGVGRVSQDDRQAVLRPGDSVVYETTRPFQWLFDSNWDVWVFSFPSESIQLSESERRLMSAQRLDGSAGLTGVVSRFLLDIARHSTALQPGSPNGSWPTPATWSSRCSAAAYVTPTPCVEPCSGR